MSLVVGNHSLRLVGRMLKVGAYTVGLVGGEHSSRLTGGMHGAPVGWF